MTLSDLNLKINVLSLNVWVLEFYSHFNLIIHECSLTLLQNSAQPSYSFNAIDLALCSALFFLVVKVLSSLIPALLSNAKLFVLVWRFQFLKALFFEDFNFGDFKDFNFWRLQLLKTSVFDSIFEDFHFEDFDFEDFSFSN